MTKITIEIIEDKDGISVKEEKINRSATPMEDRMGDVYLAAINLVSQMAGTESLPRESIN